MLCECFFDKKTDGNTLYFYFKMLSAKPEERSKLITSWRYPHPKKKYEWKGLIDSCDEFEVIDAAFVQES